MPSLQATAQAVATWELSLRRWSFIAELELDDDEVEPMRHDLVDFLRERTGRRPSTKTVHSAVLESLLNPQAAPRLVYRVEAAPRGDRRIA